MGDLKCLGLVCIKNQRQTVINRTDPTSVLSTGQIACPILSCFISGIRLKM